MRWVFEIYKSMQYRIANHTVGYIENKIIKSVFRNRFSQRIEPSASRKKLVQICRSKISNEGVKEDEDVNKNL
ncbi:hypothetical protein BFG52_10185 [Acinetobacter larvae]|uniref:Uncharacterized protein n=1 Tax=Acinetobacter larvae TaxID=1789224 RepID=A0A1B2M0I2_9GAMM|nr:hypothetical protein BFG52_10185 [Acinetobacter larvae]